MKRILFFVMIFILVVMSGCNFKDKDEIKESKKESSSSALDEQKRLPKAILDDAQKLILPIMSKEEFTNMKWDNDLIPYVEYDFLGDNEFWDYSTMDSKIFISFGDLNLDGQREMMITISAYNDKSKTFIYTVENGEVIYCGQVIAGREYAGNAIAFEFWPKDLFDVYVNEKGEIRYFSSDSDEHGTFGSNFIYESRFDNNEIIGQPVFAMVYSGDNYGYWTKDTWGDWENYESDDKAYTVLNNIISDYMCDYKRADIPFFYSEYSIPGYARELEEEYQEAVHDNILAGMAQVMQSKE